MSRPRSRSKLLSGRTLVGAWWLNFFVANWLYIFGVIESLWAPTFFLVGSALLTVLVAGHETNVLKIKTEHFRELKEAEEKMWSMMEQQQNEH